MQPTAAPNGIGNAEVKGNPKTFDFVSFHLNCHAVCGSLGNLATLRKRLLARWWPRLRRRSQRGQLSCTRRMMLGWLPRPGFHP